MSLRLAIATASTLAIALTVAACGSRTDDTFVGPRPSPGPDGLRASLAASLDRLAHAGDDAPAIAQALVDDWRVPEHVWPYVVTDAYKPRFAEADRAGAPEAHALAARLVELARQPDHAVAARVQYADDPALSPAQIRLRWALPVGRPGVVVTIGGAPVDVVFAWDNRAWRALLGVDAMTLARVRTSDSRCAAQLRAAAAPGDCLDVAWMVADAALRDDDQRLARACRLAATACPAPPPTPAVLTTP